MSDTAQTWHPSLAPWDVKRRDPGNGVGKLARRRTPYSQYMKQRPRLPVDQGAGGRNGRRKLLDLVRVCRTSCCVCMSAVMEKARATPEQDEAWKNGALHTVMKIILNPRETQHNYRLYLNSLKRYKTFEEGLENESGRDVELLMSGSMAEGLFALHWVYKDGRREAKNDIDVMLVDCSMAVVEKRRRLQRSESIPIPNKDDPLLTKSPPNTCDIIRAKCCTQEHVEPLNTETPGTASLENSGEYSDPWVGELGGGGGGTPI